MDLTSLANHLCLSHKINSFVSDPSDAHLLSTYSMTSLIVQSIYGCWAPILNAMSLCTLNMLCSGLYNSPWCLVLSIWTSTAREGEIFKLSSALSQGSCVTLMGVGRGSCVLCRSLRNTCSLACGAHWTVLQNTAKLMMLWSMML